MGKGKQQMKLWKLGSATALGLSISTMLLVSISKVEASVVTLYADTYISAYTEASSSGPFNSHSNDSESILIPAVYGVSSIVGAQDENGQYNAEGRSSGNATISELSQNGDTETININMHLSTEAHTYGTSYYSSWASGATYSGHVVSFSVDTLSVFNYSSTYGYDYTNSPFSAGSSSGTSHQVEMRFTGGEYDFLFVDRNFTETELNYTALLQPGQIYQMNIGDSIFSYADTSNFKTAVAMANTTIAYNLEITAVPVPAAVWLFGSGLIGLVGFARRKKA